MIEYVLILIISVTLLFLAKGLFSGLNNFMTSYVGDYFKCLMVQGELPALGVSDAETLAKHTSAGYKCSVNYQGVASAPGTGTAPGGGRNIGTTKPLTTAQGATKETAARRGSSANKKSKSAKNTDGDEFGGSSGEGLNFRSSVRNRSNSYNTADAEAYSDNVRSIPLSPNSNGYGDPDRYRTVSKRMEEDLLKNTRGGLNQRRPTSKKIPLLSEDDGRPGPRRSRFTPPTRDVAVAEAPDEPFTFGHFLKWLIIAGIGIALFILIGGQVLSYSKADRE